MKRFATLGFAALALILVGAGCDELGMANCITETPWGSCIDEDGIDTALVGTWTLDQQRIEGGSQPIVNPFHGRELSFDVNTLEDARYGGYFEDWENEEGADVGINLEIDSQDLVDVFPEYQPLTDTFTYGLSNDCEVTGTAQGTWLADGGVDLDTETPEGTFQDFWELKIIPAHPGGPQVVCNAGGEVSATSNAASHPLSMGPSEDDGSLIYTYAVNADWDELTLTQLNTYTGLTNIFEFSR